MHIGPSGRIHSWPVHNSIMYEGGGGRQGRTIWMAPYQNAKMAIKGAEMI